ncbi:MAG: glycosyltransferase family 2 protein [Candidatus Omnitrophota bacterium]
MKDISIIIVGTNEKEFVRICLNSIKKSKTSYSVETILVDNGSTDDTSEMVNNDFKDVRLIRNEKKLGYIFNNNMAMQHASGRYILLLNSDIELYENTLQGAISFMDKNPDAAVCGCKLVFDDGTLQLNCRRFPTPLTYLSRLPHFFHWVKFAKKFAKNRIVSRYLMRDFSHEETRKVDWLVSAFFLMRKKAIDDIGIFDKKLMQPFYLEDVEWCFRAHLKGWSVYYVPEICAVHYYQRGSVKKFNKLSIVHLVNILKFFNKHGLSMLFRRHRGPKI